VTVAEKVVRIVAPHRRVIARPEGGATVAVGCPVVVDEVEGGIVRRDAVLADGETEHGARAPALTYHQEVFGRRPPS